MIDVKNNFIGGLDLDTSYYELNRASYVDALNITRDAIVANQDTAVTNIIGNRLLDYTLPDGDNTCIGAYGNTLRGSIISFVYNTANHHSIIEYDLSARTSTKIFESLLDSDTDILGFTLNGKITGINVYNRDEGDLLFFLDSLGRPTQMNIDRMIAGEYTPVTRDIINLAKRPPLSPPTAIFTNDTTTTSNGFIKKIPRFQYRWVFDDDFKSTGSPVSAVALQPSILNSAFTNIITNNNLVNVSLNSGPQNVKAIELWVSVATDSPLFNNFQLVKTINKLDDAIGDDTDFIVAFYNDSTYPDVPLTERLLLFDYVPDAAVAQETPMGNYLAYGNITEGYDRTLNADVVLTIGTVAAGNGSTVGTLSGVSTFIDNVGFQSIYETAFSGIPATGTVINIYLVTTTVPIGVQTTLATYVTQPGDLASDVAQGIAASINALGNGSAISVTGSTVRYQFRRTLYNYDSLTITTPAASSSNSVATWKWSTSRNIGISYYDQNGKTNGILYNAKVTFPPYAENGSQVPLLPFITVEIFHRPPEWAYSYQIDFTKEPSQYLFIETQGVNTSEAQYVYFDITGLGINQDKNPTTAAVVSWTFQDGDRMRLIRRMDTGSVYGATFDTFIEGIVVEPTISNVVQTGKTFVKIKKAAPFASATYPTNGQMVLELYRSGQQAPNATNEVYYECGIQYPIISPGTSDRAHAGQTTNQSSDLVTPATIAIYNGDSYYRPRSWILVTEFGTGQGTFNIQDRNFVDFYISSVSSIDGRALTIEIDARQTTYGALIRHSDAYQPNTNINGLNRFYPNNFLDCNYSFGGIQRFTVREKFMRVFHHDKTGTIPLFNQVGTQSNGETVQIVTDRLLNPVQYYSGNWGIGTAGTSLASFNFADYYCDNIRGGIIRVSNDGQTPISVLYKVNSWATEQLPLRKGTVHIYGAYDQKLNNYIVALEGGFRISQEFYNRIFVPNDIRQFFCVFTGLPNPGDIVTVSMEDGLGNTLTVSYTAVFGDTITTISTALVNLINQSTSFQGTVFSLFSPNIGFKIIPLDDRDQSILNVTVTLTLAALSSQQTLTFSEEDNTFESFLSVRPEMMATVGTILCMFKDGQLWTHDSDRYNSFFGVDYESSITAVFNDNPITSKTYESIEEVASDIWDCPEIITNSFSYLKVPQLTNLIEQDFQQYENKFSSAILRDQNSTGGIIEGDFIKGSYCKVKLRRQEASELITLNIVTLYYIGSNLNLK